MDLIIDGFTIFGMEIKFYGILMALAMAVGVFLACKNAKFRGFSSDDVLLFALYGLPLGVIGARMFSFFSEMHFYDSFWQIFNLRTGGMSIFGAIIGGAVGVLLFSLIHKKNFLAFADLAVPSLIFAQAIGRWGNFFNQEVYGFQVDNPSLQWFPFSVFIESTQTWHLATFFYEFLLNLVIFTVLMLLLRKFRVETKGVLLATYLIGYGTVRSILEPLRMNEYILYAGPVRISHLTSILCVVLGLGLLVFVLIKKNRLQNQTVKENIQARNVEKKDVELNESEIREEIITKKEEDITKKIDKKENLHPDKNDESDLM